MNLDLRTIVVMLLVSSVLMAITLAIGIKTGRDAGFAKWNISLALLSLGWMLVAARGMLPDIFGIALADAFLIAGLCVELVAVIEFGGGRAPRALLTVPGPLFFVLLIPTLENYPALTLVAGIGLAAALGAIAVVSARLPPVAGPARWALAISSLAGAVMLSVRAANIWLNPGRHPDVFTGGDLNAATFLVLFAMTLVIPVAFLLMHRERTETELTRLATFDLMTGLFNRRAFMELAERELARARRTGSPYAVLMMDLDLFKRVNDEYGHQAGDRVLAAFGAVASRSVRTEDLVGRYGGEEFCAILPGATMDKAIEIAERIRQAVAKDSLGGLPQPITVSIGVAACGADAGGTLATAIARADEALYRAKHEGRNRTVGLEYGGPDSPRSPAA